MNRFRTLVLYFVLILASVVLLFGIGRTQRSLNAIVEKHHLRFTGQIKNAPPMVVFTTMALGSFRGVVADLLWLRAGALQDEKNYFEMVQLARWITDLQPTFSGATAYLAWNMAYNISVTTSSFEERWRWVKEGIRLIRDQAIEYNPEDPILYKEMAWIYLHKLGNILDDANFYYKNKLAMQMTGIVGPDPAWQDLAAAMERAFGPYDYNVINLDPEWEKLFVKLYPADSAEAQAVKAAGYKDFEAFYTAFRSASPAALPETVSAALNRWPTKKRQLLDYMRAVHLYRELKYDARMIRDLNEKYGQMDWRVPESQAIYWANLGILRSPGRRNVACDRIIASGLYESFRAGRILMLDNNAFESMMVVPNLDLIGAVYRTYTEQYDYHDGGTGNSSFRSARINFLKDAVTKLYVYGRFDEAEKYYRILAKDDGNQGVRNAEQFVQKNYAEAIKSGTVKQIDGMVIGLINQSIIYMLYNDMDAAVANERLARFVYVTYQSDMGAVKRLTLPPYAEMKKGVVDSVLANFDRSGQKTLAARLRAKLAEEQQRAAEERARQEKSQKP